MIYIAVCLSRSEGSSENFLVSDRYGNTVFSREDAVKAAVKDDMEEYLSSEKRAGRKAKIVGNRIEWDDNDIGLDLEARWYTYCIDPATAVPFVGD